MRESMKMALPDSGTNKYLININESMGANTVYGKSITLWT